MRERHLRDRPPDYAKDSPYREYFHSQHLLAYYQSLKVQEDRRDISHRIVSGLGEFLEQMHDPNSASLLRTFLAGRVETDGRLVEDIMRSRSRGVELLEPSRPMSYETLKRDYRRTVLKHHPDKGGGHEDFIAINAAYEGLQEAVASALSGGEMRDGLEASQFTGQVAATAIMASQDLHDLDAAALWLRKAASHGWLADLNDLRLQWQLPKHLTYLSRKLTFIGRIPESEEVDGILRSLGHVVSGPKKRPTVTLNHSLQVENALRHGLIDDKRYARAKSKLAEADGPRTEAAKLFEGRVSRRGFAPLPYDQSHVNHTGTLPDLVPEPPYFTYDIADLSPEQQAEYAMNYGPTPAWRLSLKYQFIRIHSILRSLRLSIRDLEWVLDEAKTMEEGQDPKRPRGEWGLVRQRLQEINSAEGRRRQNLIDDAFSIFGSQAELWEPERVPRITLSLDLDDLLRRRPR